MEDGRNDPSPIHVKRVIFVSWHGLGLPEVDLMSQMPVAVKKHAWSFPRLFLLLSCDLFFLLLSRVPTTQGHSSMLGHSMRPLSGEVADLTSRNLNNFKTPFFAVHTGSGILLRQQKPKLSARNLSNQYPLAACVAWTGQGQNDKPAAVREAPEMVSAQSASMYVHMCVLYLKKERASSPFFQPQTND